MKRALVLVALALLVPMVEGGMTPFLPRATCPDLALLLVMGMGLFLRGAATGVAFAAGIGFVSDLLSGSLQGQHALLFVFAFGLARLTSLQINLQGAIARMALAAVLTLAAAFGMAALTAFFAKAGAPLASGPELLRQTVVNALVAPPLIGAVAWGVARLGDDDGRRLLRLEPRRFSA